MNENSDLLPNLLHEEFEMQMRGYSRRQVDDFVARRNSEIRELEQRLARTLDDSEHLRRELSTARQQALAGRPAHEEVSERIAQILKLADDEARAQKGKADDDIAQQRSDAQQESERVRAEAREQAERMLTAAQEQAERTISAARDEADKTRTVARTEADRLTSETRKKSDTALSQAKAQAKKVLDEATARATAIHDGAERRLNLLSTRHAETVRRLSDILDGVQGLVTAEAARMSLEEEVNHTASAAIAAQAQTQAPDPGLVEDDAADFTAAPDSDLALLAPPAANTISAAMAPPSDDSLPPAAGRGPGRHSSRPQPAIPESSYDIYAAPVDTSGAPTSPGSGRVLPGRPDSSPSSASASVPPPPAGRPSRTSAAPPDSPPRASLSRTSDGLSGHGLGDLFSEREPQRDQPRRTGLIDPDEPDEGLRLLT